MSTKSFPEPPSTSTMTPTSHAPHRDADSRSASAPNPNEDESLLAPALGDVGRRLHRGLLLIAVLAAVGLLLGALAAWWSVKDEAPRSLTRVSLSFPGFERGEYPDRSEFQPDDLRSHAVVAAAIERLDLSGPEGLLPTVRQGLTIEGVVPHAVVAERDRVRASGQQPAAYIPDSYRLSLTLPADLLDAQQRERLLNEVVTVFGERFQRTYGEMPRAFGNVFDALAKADFTEYELLLNTEIENVTAYLRQQSAHAGAFRSATTNLSFEDLLERTHFFAQIQLNETLGLVHEYGLSRDRDLAMSKMDYHIQLLGDRERRALEEERVINDLLAQTQERAPNYVIGIRAEATQRPQEGPIMDRGLVDSLLANDAYNFLVREALEAGFRTKAVQSEKARMLQLRDNMRSFTEADLSDRAEIITQAQESLASMRTAYDSLIDAIRRTYRDYAEQRFGNAVRVSQNVTTTSKARPVALAGGMGGMLGVALGAGLSLLGCGAGARGAAKKG